METEKKLEWKEALEFILDAAKQYNRFYGTTWQLTQAIEMLEEHIVLDLD